MTECSRNIIEFLDLGRRQVVADFQGGHITSDGGALLLREVDAKLGLLDRLAACFTDHRDPDQIEFPVALLLKQRIFGLSLGYEDLNDHDRLRHDPLLATLVGVDDPLGEHRRDPADRGKALAGKSTLNRLELTAVGATADSRYKKTVANLEAMAALLPEVYIHQQTQAPTRIVLDLDATDDPVHGEQLGRFFHGYYGHYCFLPLYIFAGDHPLAAVLRPADLDAAAGCIPHLERIVTRLRHEWPDVEIVLRGDSGFCREWLMRWCEERRIDYVFGLAKNKRLLRILGQEMHEAKEESLRTGASVRSFKDFDFRTQKSWGRSRRVVGKAEHLKGNKANPRFVVTTLSAEVFDAKTLYEVEYCGRGTMENRIKEQQLFLFADRLSCETMRANQLRLYFSTFAYVLLRALREHGLKATLLAAAQCDTIRLKLFKIGAVVRVSVRRVLVSLSESYPWRTTYEAVLRTLRTWTPPAPLLAAAPLSTA